MSDWPSVTVIVPVLNGEQTIGACLQALRTQTYPGRMQPVVINDGSTDRTSNVARGFTEAQVIDQANRGRAAARNRGIAESAGEVLAFTDADCVPRPDWLETLVRRLRERERRGIVGGQECDIRGPAGHCRLDRRISIPYSGQDLTCRQGKDRKGRGPDLRHRSGGVGSRGVLHRSDPDTRDRNSRDLLGPGGHQLCYYGNAYLYDIL